MSSVEFFSIEFVGLGASSVVVVVTMAAAAVVLVSVCGDLAGLMRGAVASPPLLLKSPRQTIQVSDIQRCRAGTVRRRVERW